MPFENLQKPLPLKPGDTIAAVTTAWGGVAVFPERYKVGVQRLQDVFELHVVKMQYTDASPDWLNMHPEKRAEDLMNAFRDPNIKGIFSTIGGNDSIALLPYIDFDVIRANPKVVMGFSDTTVLHFMCLKAGLSTFYGPSILCEFSENVEMSLYTVESIQKTLFSSQVIGQINASSDWTDEFLDWGKRQNQQLPRLYSPHEGYQFIQGTGIISGQLLGGCLEVLEQLLETNIWPDLNSWQDTFLFIEISELKPNPQEMRRILQKIAEKGVVHVIKGILFGHPGNLAPGISPIDYQQVIQDIAQDSLNPNFAIVTNLNFGHTIPSFVIPYGALAEIDFENKIFSIQDKPCANIAELMPIASEELSEQNANRFALNRLLNRRISFITMGNTQNVPYLTHRLFQTIHPHARRENIMALINALGAQDFQRSHILIDCLASNGGIYPHEKDFARTLAQYAAEYEHEEILASKLQMIIPINSPQNSEPTAYEKP